MPLSTFEFVHMLVVSYSYLTQLLGAYIGGCSILACFWLTIKKIIIASISYFAECQQRNTACLSISRRPTCDVVAGSNRYHFSAICSSGSPTHLRWIADILKLPRNANRIGAISNHSICKYGYYGSDGA